MFSNQNARNVDSFGVKICRMLAGKMPIRLALIIAAIVIIGWSPLGLSGKGNAQITSGSIIQEIAPNQTKPASSQQPPADLRSSTNSIGMEFVTIPAGKFMMGCSSGSQDCRDDEKPQHEVTISRSFELGKYEVTQGEWVKVKGSNPSYYKGGDRLPVERVNWNEAQAFIAKLNARKDGYRYRLPTEAEWEYAARAGTAGPNYGNLDDIAWHMENSGDDWPFGSGHKTHPVGQKQPNAYGLYDMLGNVWEWCSDRYGESYYGSSPAVDPKGPSSGRFRVQRGKSFFLDPRFINVFSRRYWGPGHRRSDTGFRVCREKL
jgi:formylglycine-generating enzyme required for sulfatase activity